MNVPMSIAQGSAGANSETSKKQAGKQDIYRKRVWAQVPLCDVSVGHATLGIHSNDHPRIWHSFCRRGTKNYAKCSVHTRWNFFSLNEFISNWVLTPQGWWECSCQPSWGTPLLTWSAETVYGHPHWDVHGSGLAVLCCFHDTPHRGNFGEAGSTGYSLWHSGLILPWTWGHSQEAGREAGRFPASCDLPLLSPHRPRMHLSSPFPSTDSQHVFFKGHTTDFYKR